LGKFRLYDLVGNQKIGEIDEFPLGLAHDFESNALDMTFEENHENLPVDTKILALGALFLVVSKKT